MPQQLWQVLWPSEFSSPHPPTPFKSQLLQVLLPDRMNLLLWGHCEIRRSDRKLRSLEVAGSSGPRPVPCPWVSVPSVNATTAHHACITASPGRLQSLFFIPRAQVVLFLY